MWTKGGFKGWILNVDLSRNKVVKTPLEKEFALKFIGGTGFVAKMLWDLTSIETDPLSPENPLIIANGPLTGALWSGSGRITVGAKAPLTGIYGDANFGGHFGPELKFAGYDMLIVQGQAKKPVYIWIDDDEVEIRSASDLWGLDTWDTHDTLLDKLADRYVKMVYIGPAGENLVKYAALMSEYARAAGRTGMGAVMGSKKLKAIAVRGTKGVQVADPDGFMKIYSKIRKNTDSDPFTAQNTMYGTTLLVEAMNEIGRLPTKNHQMGQFPEVDKISGDTIMRNYKVRDRACFGCQVACKSQLAIPDGQYAGTGECPEYETVDSFGARIWNADLPLLLHEGWLCERYGLDTISTGAAIALAMELWEKGIITEEDTDGLDFTWGNKDTINKIVTMIAKREGFGNILADGVQRVAKKIGRGAEKYAMQVKGMAIAAQDGRAQKSMAIAHAASVRGADHLKHCTFYDEVGFDETITLRFGKKYLPEMADRLAVKYKGTMAKTTETLGAAVNFFELCVSSGTFWPPVIWWEELSELFTALTGFRKTPNDIKRDCERIVLLRKAYNIRLGLDRRHDTLPERFTKEPAPTGPNRGETVDLKYLLDDYYKAWGWDVKTGLIPRKNYEAVGLEEIATELEKLGKLPE